MLATLGLLLIAGHETTVNLIANGVLAFARQPDQFSRLRDEPALIRSAVEEVLRFDPPVHADGRLALEDIELPSGTVKQWEQPVILLPAANRDPAYFADADCFDIARTDNRHLSFGFGIHHCLGAPLARAEAQVALGYLARRFSANRAARRPSLLQGQPRPPWRVISRSPAASLTRSDAGLKGPDGGEPSDRRPRWPGRRRRHPTGGIPVQTLRILRQQPGSGYASPGRPRRGPSDGQPAESRPFAATLPRVPSPALFDLTDKVAVVTGGARGIGRAVSLGLAEAGADVVIASRNLENCEAWAAEVNARTGRRTWARHLHVGRWEEIAPFAAEVWETTGAVHILVNNAGMSPLYDDLREVTEDYWEKVVGVNLKGPFKMTVEFGCRMFEADGGSIINVSSTGPIRSRPHHHSLRCRQSRAQHHVQGLHASLGPESASQHHRSRGVPDRCDAFLGVHPVRHRRTRGDGGYGCLPGRRERPPYHRGRDPGGGPALNPGAPVSVPRPGCPGRDGRRWAGRARPVGATITAVAAPLILVYAILLAPAAVAFGILILAAVSLLVDAWRCRHPSTDLLQRVDAHPSTTIGDEAQWWLDRQRPH